MCHIKSRKISKAFQFYYYPDNTETLYAVLSIWLIKGEINEPTKDRYIYCLNSNICNILITLTREQARTQLRIWKLAQQQEENR